MIDETLRADIAARVRREQPAPGRRRAQAWVLARDFAGRAPRLELVEAIKDARAQLSGGGEAQDPAAPVLLAPADMVECTAKKMRLTRAGCFRLWRGAKDQPPPAWEGRSACVGCANGARNAGYAPSPVDGLIRELERTCSRCLHPASRLINGRFCISCYNRHNEALRGRNARGSRPKISGFLFTAQIAKSTGGQVAVIIDRNVVSSVETMLVNARQAVAHMAFGWAPRGPGDTVDLT